MSKDQLPLWFLWQMTMRNGKRRPEKSAKMGWEGLLLPRQKPWDEYNGSSRWTPTHLCKGLALLQCGNQIKNAFIVNFWLNLCNNKKTKAYFSERSRFIWLSLLFQDFFLRDRSLLCSSGWSPAQDPWTAASRVLGVQCHRAQHVSRFLTEGMHKIFLLLTETRLFNVSLKYLF